MRIPSSTAVGVGVGVGALAGLWAWKHYAPKGPPNTWEEVGVVSQLTLYPLKSGRGVAIEEGQATEFGLEGGAVKDRSFMVMTSDGTFITCRQVGRLATVVTDVKGQTVTLRADGEGEVTFDLQQVMKEGKVNRVRIWNQTTSGFDCGDAAAEWLTRVLYDGGTSVRLVYQGGLVKDRPARKPDYFEFPQFRKSDRLVYADTSSFMVASESSLDDLNGRLAEPVSMSWFRPNVVVRGARPFDEDDWAFLKIGDVVLRRVKPCERCLLTTVNPASGERHPQQEPLATLRTYRTPTGPPRLAKVWAQKPVFGMQCATDSVGSVRVGDKVMAVRASRHPEYKLMEM
ncbi:mitochondrial amidoxime reducing component 2-like [Penaeus japonicus]|uniref:mitochondrial amidoxime reducing component 2-like n=1 Tax=Penaeus japonicus TaxID=27405 RepID=UPI001C70D2DB|nr:mitochondrial amidoxime reducing component 2-like [Penaeus japonicus]